MNALRIQVRGRDEEVCIAGPFSIAKQTAVDAISVCEKGQFGGCICRSPIVMGMGAYDHGLSVCEESTEVFDLVGVNVVTCDLDSGLKIEDRRFFRRTERPPPPTMPTRPPMASPFRDRLASPRSGKRS